MSDITGKGKATIAAETGTAREENTVLTDLVMDGLDVQISPSLQDGIEGAANTRAMAYRDRILEAAGRSKETA